MVSGVPVVVDGLSRALVDALWVLLGAAVVVMALALVLVFRSRLRLLPLALALAAAALTFGLFGLLRRLADDGLDRRPADPDRPRRRLRDPVPGPLRRGGRGRRRGCRGGCAAPPRPGGPTIATACLATMAGFLALLLSPTPMVRSFGLLLVVGVAIAFRPRAHRGLRGAEPALAQERGVPRCERRYVAAKRTTQRAERTPDPPGRLLVATAVALTEPRRVLGVGLALAVVGWGVGTQIETHVGRPRAGAAEHSGGAGPERAAGGDRRLRRARREDQGPRPHRPGDAALDGRLQAPGADGEWVLGARIPAAGRPRSAPGRRSPTSSSERRALSVAPTFAPPCANCRRTTSSRWRPPIRAPGLPGHTALVSFGIRAQSLEDQQALIERIRGEIGEPGAPGGPPAGVDVELAGLPVIAAAAANDLSSSRYWIALAGLLAVALVLLAVYRSLARTLVPLAPVVLAGGWSALILWVSGIPLNPMSADVDGADDRDRDGVQRHPLGPLPRGAGRGHARLAEALRAAYARTGAAVLASALTATAGFAVLIASDVRMLRDFGIVTVIDLSVALLGVMVALPAALVLWSER